MGNNKIIWSQSRVKSPFLKPDAMFERYTETSKI